MQRLWAIQTRRSAQSRPALSSLAALGWMCVCAQGSSPSPWTRHRDPRMRRVYRQTAAADPREVTSFLSSTSSPIFSWAWRFAVNPRHKNIHFLLTLHLFLIMMLSRKMPLCKQKHDTKGNPYVFIIYLSKTKTLFYPNLRGLDFCNKNF